MRAIAGLSPVIGNQPNTGSRGFWLKIETAEQVAGLGVAALQRLEAEPRLDQPKDRCRLGQLVVNIAASCPRA
jgi:hypothetical protein